MSEKQIAAWRKMKSFTDFNDLANKSTLGKDGVDRQVRCVLDDLVNTHNLKHQMRKPQKSIDRVARPTSHRGARIA